MEIVTNVPAVVLLIGSFLVMIALRMPIVFAIGLSSIATTFYLDLPLQMVAQNKVDGIIALTYNPDLKIPPDVRSVSIDRYLSGSTTCVASDNYNGGRLAAQKLVENGKLKTNPMKGMVAAVSVGIVNGEAVCDLEYVEDSAAETDMNVVMTEDGRIIEVQGTAEGEPFTHEELLTLLALARGGIESIVATQKAALAN